MSSPFLIVIISVISKITEINCSNNNNDKIENLRNRPKTSSGDGSIWSKLVPGESDPLANLVLFWIVVIVILIGIVICMGDFLLEKCGKGRRDDGLSE